MPDTPNNLLRSVIDMLVEALDASSPEPGSRSVELQATCLSALASLTEGPAALLQPEKETNRLRLTLASESLPCPAETFEIDWQTGDQNALDLAIQKALPDQDYWLSTSPEGVWIAFPSAELKRKETQDLAQLEPLLPTILRLASALERIHNEQLVDGPTGLFNRQYMDTRLRAELARASRHGHPLSILLVRVRGTEGRLESKSVEQVAKLFGTNPKADTFSFRRSDVCARAGWERFMAVLPETPKWGALTKAERLRRAVLNQGFARAAIGVAAFPEDASDITSLLASAESALKLDQEE